MGKKNILVIDLETTGLDSKIDEIIEVGCIFCEFDAATNKLVVKSMYGSLREPLSKAIDEQITKLTGIEHEHAVGEKPNWTLIQSLVDQADILVAHNAQFDRGFLENSEDLDTDGAHWGCSQQDIDWFGHGFKSRALNYLAADKGFVNSFAHRATFDCATLVRVMDGHFQELWANSFEKQFILYAFRAPFAKKDLLKVRNYRWDPKKSVWHKVLYEKNLKEEETYLENHIYDGTSFHESNELA